MNLLLKNRRLFIILAVVFALALLADIVNESDLKYRIEARTFENKLHKAEKEGMKCLHKISTADSLLFEPEYIKDIHANHIYSLFKYTDGNLATWTNNSIILPSAYDNELFNEKLIKLNNRWVLVNELQKGDDIYLCLITLYLDYSIQNKDVKSGFNPEFGLINNTGFGTDIESGYPIHDTSGQYLFSLVFKKASNFFSVITVIPVIMWLLFTFIFLIATDRITRWLVQKGFIYLGFIASTQIAIIFYLIFLLIDKPGIFTSMGIFSPFSFNLGPIVPSTGHLLLLSVLFLFVCLEFYKYFPDPSCGEKKSWHDYFKLTVFLTIASFIFFLFSRLVNVLVLDSNIHFRIYEILDISLFTFISMAAAGLILVGLSIFLLRVVRFCRLLPLKIVLPALFVSAIILYLLNLFSGQYSLIHIIVFLLLAIQSWFFRREKVRLINISVTFTILTAAYAAYIIPGLTWQKETEKLKVISVNFSNQNDIYGEALLIDLWSEIKNDSLLPVMMNKDFLSPDDVSSVYSYLDRQYFNGYWDNYDKIYTICEFNSPLYFESDTTRVENCFDFFQTRAREIGLPLVDSNLVFLDNNSGRPYYLGCLYFTNGSGRENGLFIELINLLKYTQSGYPELLKDEEYDKRINTGNYSIAKYINDSLVLQTGEFPFENHLQFTIEDSAGYSTFSLNADDEYFIYSDDDTSVVVARSRLTFLDIIVTFTYLFVAFFILHLIVLMILKPPENILPGTLNFTQKLQVAFVGILLGCIVIIGTVVVILSINQYRGKHYENIQEKIGSVYIELDDKFSELDTLTLSWSADNYPDLDALLIKFSNVFRTDINLYDTNAELIATSRREMYDKNLKSKRMNFEAYTRLKYVGQVQYVHNERIGNLDYLSAYTPFVNNRNKVLAYLNLPYFNMQSRITEEISNLIVAMINFTMILIVISLSIAVFISVRITNPLRMLQQGLASVRLEEKSKPLEYSGHDEISELVNQYNKMLDELQTSALKLARSEREDAWREMAKQIAHEIKNPLTPMKLNVQQLYKKWKDNPENFEESLKNFKQYQIEQIDNLSSIASEFSNFARMPKASPRETDLVSHINAVADLYNDIKNIDLNINFNSLREVTIFADKEQINSMLSNVFRNAIQAIPGSRRGIINVSLTVREQKALIRIEDNGIGIPYDLKDKLFTPNFTTKSSGMGLGLAIVKRVVETADGRIWFDSEPGRGTVFYIEYPVLSYKRQGDV